MYVVFFFFKQKTAYEMRISDWSSDVCSSDLEALSRINAAKAHCPTRLPVQLFLAGGPELRPFLAGLEINAAAELEPATPEVAPRRLAVPRNELLTAREQEVVHLLGEGNPNKITAYRLGLSEATVRFHLRNIYRKLRVQIGRDNV